MRFYAQMLRCLKDCFEGRYEQLNVNMNFFILLKNELQTPYLKTAEPMCMIMKKAMAKYPLDEDTESISDENAELRILEKILNNQPIEIEEVDELQSGSEVELAQPTIV